MDSAPCPKCGKYHEPGNCPKPIKEQSEIKEKKDLPEFDFDSETGITAIEQKIIDGTDIETAKKLADLETDNLHKHSDKIVGVRSEDIIYFLECLQNGHIPTEVKTQVRNKGVGNGSDSTLYITPNLDSAVFKDSKYTKPDTGYIKREFRSLVQENVREYSEVAMIQAVYRNLWPYIIDMSKFTEEVNEMFPSDENFNWENFWSGFFSSRADIRKPARDLLWKHLEKTNIKIKTYNAFLKTLPARGGIVFGIKNEATSQFSLEDSPDSIEHEEVPERIQQIRAEHGITPNLKGVVDEVVLRVNDGQFPIELIAAIEPLGEFEDSVLEILKQKYNL